MSDSNNISKLIEGYVQGNLTSAELEVFETLRKADTNGEIQERIDLEELTQETIEGSFQADLRSQMKNDLSRIDKQRTLRKRLAVSAVFLGALFIGLYLYSSFHSQEEGSDSSNVKISKGNEYTHSTSDRDTYTELKEVEDFKSSNQELVEPMVEPTIKATKDNQQDTIPVFTESAFKIEEKSIVSIDQKHSSNEAVDQENVFTDDSVFVIKENLCNEIFSISSKKACYNQSNGEISVSTDNNVEADYYIDNIEGEFGEFTDLEVGTYQITAKYYDKCVYTKDVKVEEDICIPKALSFTPSQGEVLIIVEDIPFDGSMEVFDRSGERIVQKEFIQNDQITWDGYADRGGIPQSGLYICILTFENDEKRTIQLTVLQ